MSEQVTISLVNALVTVVPLLITAWVTIKKLNYTTQVSEKAAINADRAYTEANGLNNKIATLTGRFTQGDIDKELSDSRITNLENTKLPDDNILSGIDETTKETNKTAKATLKQVKKIAGSE